MRARVAPARRRPLRPRFAFAAFLLGAAVAPAPAQTRQQPLRGIENYITAAMRQWNVPGLAIAVVKGDSVVYLRGFGVREMGKSDAVDANTLFAVASNTKAVTATAVGMLVSEGRLAWDDPATRHLPRLALYDPWVTREITVRDMLSHRSGLGTWAGDLLWYGSDLPLDSVIAGIHAVPASSGFRSRYGYSNLMFVAAGQIIPALAGMPWQQFVRTMLLVPLGMTRTTTSVTELAARDNVATPHARVDGRLAPVAYRNVDNAAPAAALNSSVAEWAQWLRLQLGYGAIAGRRIVDSAVIAETRTPATIEPPFPIATRALYPSNHFRAYGLGWALWDFRGRLVVSHGGGMDGMFSYTGFLPEEQLGVAVFTNREEHELAHALFLHVVELFLGRPTRDWSATLLEQARREAEAAQFPTRMTGTRPSLGLDAYAGRYVNEILGEAVITYDAGRLRLSLPHHPGLWANLGHWQGDEFQARWSERYFRESLVRFDAIAGSVREFRVKVRPDWVDPLEYRFRRLPERPTR